MDFIDEIRTFAKNVPTLSEKITTEEGTKNALIMPFIRILGYDVFNPHEVNPELNADIGTKKGEKVDYAIMKEGEPVMLIECKVVTADLRKEHASQLYRYFSVTPSAQVGILTNGIIYQFYTDLEKENTMDQKPFLEINLLDIKEPLIEELKKFTKAGLNLDALEDTASQLKYTREIIQILNKEFSKPTDDFIKFLAPQVYPKKFTEKVKEKFSIIIKDSTSQFLNEKINERLKSAMEADKTKESVAPQAGEAVPAGQMQTENANGIVTTEEEYEGYYIVKAILSEVTDPGKVVIRDAKSYCAILYDDNNRKPICRFYFDGKQKFIGVFDNETKTENKIPVTKPGDLFKLGNHFKNVVVMYEKSVPVPKKEPVKDTIKPVSTTKKEPAKDAKKDEIKPA